MAPRNGTSAPLAVSGIASLAPESDDDPDARERQLGRELRELVPSLASYVFGFVRVDGELEIAAFWSDDPQLEDQLRELYASLPGTLRELFVAAPLTIGTTREILARADTSFESTVLPKAYDALGIAELFSVSARGPSGEGTAFGVCLDSSHDLPSPEIRAQLSHIAAHLAEGGHLRQGPYVAPVTVAEAILTGTVDSAEALELWQGLVEGRWSLVDHFDGCGRRYHVATENRPETIEDHALSRREAEIVATIASGTDTKNTAYALGLDAATVRGHLRAAMSKLGVGTRAELISLWTMLFGVMS